VRLLVTGCGRSGTMWMAAALSSTGLDCGHERAFTPGYGGSAPRWGEGDWTAEGSGHGAPFTPLPGTHVVHLVRHPVHVVSSALHRSRDGLGRAPQSREFVLRHLPHLGTISDPLERAARSWIDWNSLVVSAEVVRLDAAGAGWVTARARMVDGDARPARLPEPMNAASRRPRPVSWSRLARVPGMVEAARRYGFATTTP